MSNASINIRTDAELKAKAQQTLADLGLDMTTAINIFLNQVVYRNGIPFEITKPPKVTTKLGGWEDKIKLAEDFDEPLDDFQEYMR
ncbi:type II toxin-antitoxin system RelB/DinJ family antitoxin [Alkanindiges sp. WGS2144]|uniref:type II toxin-antitoxin system RelB/DinJ family antitoxin n=1 Tax=Alkanindiges sp. WGS2144 TaxID=3366808 RepID=UPI003752A977